MIARWVTWWAAGTVCLTAYRWETHSHNFRSDLMVSVWLVAIALALQATKGERA